MKTVNVPQIGGLDELVAIVSDPKRFKAHLAGLKGALAELRESAGGVEALREAASLRNKAKGAMAEAAAVLAAAREEAEALRSQAAKEAEEVTSAKEALAERIRGFEQDLAALKYDQARFHATTDAWEKKKANQEGELKAKAEELARRALELAGQETAMRGRLEAASAALEA